MFAPSSSNPVPLGRAGTGDAVVFGEGLGGLRYLQRTDYLAAQQRARAALAAQRQQDQDYKDFMSRVKLSDDGGVHYLPLLQQRAQQVGTDMAALATDRSLDRVQRGLKQAAYQDQYNREAKASKRNDDYVSQLAQRVTADKRYDTTKTTQLLHGTLYKDGQIIPPLDYDPQVADSAVNTGYEHLNAPEIFKTYLRGSHPDAVTSAREALPGGRGYRNVASSDVYELTPEGKIAYDPKTNLPVVKATPQSLNYFDSDPVNKQYLDGLEAAHQQALASATAKMQNLEQLTPEEAEAVRAEQSPAGRRMELFKRGLMEQGYGRQSSTILAKAAPRPRVGRSTANQSAIMGGGDYLPGAVVGGEGVGGGMTSYGVLGALSYGKPGQQAKRFVGKNVKHQEVITTAADGSPVVSNQANQLSGDVTYGQRHILLRSSKTGNVYLGSPAAVQAAKQGDTSLMDAEARKYRAQHPEYKPEIYVEANATGPNGLQAGSPEEYYEQLKAQEDSFRQAYNESGGKPNPQLSAQMQQMGLLLGGSGKPPRFRTEHELREKANKEYAHISKTHYVRYSGPDKLMIDQATDYALRTPQNKRQMERAVAEAERRTKPQADDEHRVTLGRGPLAGALVPAAPATPAKAGPAANKYGFKFGKK